uniref:Ovule protein n=1 Tax=Steinernema glaseri TaxID=37863 RepID=A0A1I7XW13_9BILA
MRKVIPKKKEKIWKVFDRSISNFVNFVMFLHDLVLNRFELHFGLQKILSSSRVEKSKSNGNPTHIQTMMVMIRVGPNPLNSNVPEPVIGKNIPM